MNDIKINDYIIMDTSAGLGNMNSSPYFKEDDGIVFTENKLKCKIFTLGEAMAKLEVLNRAILTDRTLVVASFNILITPVEINVK